MLVALLLRVRQQGLVKGVSKRQWLGWLFAGCLGLLAAQDAWDNFGPGRSARKAAASAEARLEAQADADAADAQAEAKIETAAIAASTAASVAASVPAPAAASVPASAPALSDAQRIEMLQDQIAELRKPKPLTWRQQFDHVIDSVGVSFGWGIVYFSLLPA